MFEGLAEAIDGLEIPVDGDALAAVFALRDRLDARLAEAVAAFDRHELWECDGATSMTAWLAGPGRAHRPPSPATYRRSPAGWGRCR